MSVMSNSQDCSVRQSSQQHLTITSLNQLQTLYGKTKPSDIAQSLVYGDKPKMKENKPKTGKLNTDHSIHMNSEHTKTFASNQSSSCLKPSKYTVLSQQLFSHIPNQLEAHRSQRAFYTRDQNILLSPERLNSLPNQAKDVAVPEVCNRLLEYKTFVSEKKKTLKEQVDNEYLSECRFQPQIDPKSRQLALKSTNQEVRSADDFHEDQMRHLQRIQDKRELLLKQQQESELQLLNNPQLNPNTIKLASKYSSQPLLERLNERPQRSQQTLVGTEESYPFKPEINQRSKNLKREETVEEILYKDAQNRLKTKKLTETIVPESLIQPTDKSLSWFVQRFIKEFYFQLSSLKRIQDTKDYSKIYEEDFQLILVGLGFGRSSELWNLLNNGFYVLSRNLLVILLAIMAVPQHLIEIPLYKPKVEENISFKSQFKIDENGNVILTDFDCSELHKKFYTLYLNTKQQTGNGIRRQQARSPQQVRCSSPKISEKSKQMAESKKANMNLQDWFEQQELRRKQNLEALKQQVLEEEMKECKRITRPVTINLAELAKPVQKQQDKSTVDYEFENQAQHCTFQPSISLPAKNTESNQYVATEMQKQAARMKEARLRKQTLQNLKEKGLTTNNRSRKNEKLKTEVSINKEPRPQRAKSRPMFESVPLLFVDVKIDDAKTARIIVYEGDKSAVLAEQFAHEHHLDEPMRSKLKELLDVQINSLLTKIDEECDEEQ